MPHSGLHARVLPLADLKSTSIALAQRCAEALARPECEAVIIGDLGRPGRPAFLQALCSRGVRQERAHFEEVAGWGAPAPRHELISAAKRGEEAASQGVTKGMPQRASVGLLRLTRECFRGAPNVDA